MSGPQKWKYHREKPACIVQNNDEEAALGPGWWDSPADVNQPWPDPATPDDSDSSDDSQSSSDSDDQEDPTPDPSPTPSRRRRKS